LFTVDFQSLADVFFAGNRGEDVIRWNAPRALRAIDLTSRKPSMDLEPRPARKRPALTDAKKARRITLAAMKDSFYDDIVSRHFNNVFSGWRDPLLASGLPVTPFLFGSADGNLYAIN